MMVNQVNNNPPQWQSTIPNQMPWLNSIPNNTPPMQFGQSSYEPDVTGPIPLPATSLLSPLTASSNQLANTIAPVQTSAPTSGLMLTNPFNPQQLLATQQLTDGHSTLPNQQYNSAHTSSQPPVGPSCSTQPSGHFESPFLTQLPIQQTHSACFESQPMQQKRSSIEMEDEMTEKEAPPTKQQLSESRLFKRFGSLQLDGETSTGNHDDEIDSDDSDDGRLVEGTHDRKEFNRYVYLLFKDKKSNNLFDVSTSRAMDRFLREERDKLNKAVILWNPPMRNFFVNEIPDSDDDDEITYLDHKDFLKSNSGDNDSIIITEVEDDAEIDDAIPTDDVMLD